MAISLTFDRAALNAAPDRLRQKVLTAVKRAVIVATDQAKADIRAAIRAGTTSTRLPNIIGSQAFPAAPKLSFRPTGSIYPRGPSAERIFRQLGEGATIRVKNARALAVPLHNQRDGRGALLQPRAFPGLVYIPNRRGGRSVGVLALPSSRTSRGLLTAKDRRAIGAQSRARVQARLGEDYIAMFVLVRAVPFFYKSVSLYQLDTSVSSVSFTNTCEALKPYSPVMVAASRNGGGDIALTWVRRSRIPSAWSDGVDVPLGETAERYDVEIISGGTVVRTITGLTTAAATYLAAEQVTDFGGTQASLTVRIYQVSPEVGRGAPRVATI